MNRKLLAILLTLSAVALTACGTDPGTENTGNGKANCGNGKIDANEACDGANLNGKSCSSVDPKYTGGTLSCNNQCQFELKDCTPKSTQNPAPATCDGKAIDTGEECDGTHLPAGKTCSTETSGAKPDGSLKCNACKIDTSDCKSSSSPQPTVMKCDEAQKWFGKKDDKKTLVDGEYGKFTNDAGIAAALTEIKKIPEGKTGQAVDLDITNVVVTSVDRKGKWAFVQDQAGAIFLRLENGTEGTFEPGDVISFKITKAVNFFGNPQAATISDYQKTGTGKVMALDYTKEANTKDDVFKFVTFQGKLSNGAPCGGDNICSTITAYNDPSKTITYRRNGKHLTSIQDGDCVIFAGPLDIYKGALQLDAKNFNWTTKIEK